DAQARRADRPRLSSRWAAAARPHGDVDHWSDKVLTCGRPPYSSRFRYIGVARGWLYEGSIERADPFPPTAPSEPSASAQVPRRQEYRALTREQWQHPAPVRGVPWSFVDHSG